MTRKTLLLAALIAAAPAFAQSAPPAPPAPPQMGHHAGQKGPHGMGMNARMFPSMSEAGRKTMHDAMMTGGNRRDDRQKVEAARGKMLAALEAERFDAGAVKRAMDEERALSDASRQQRQVAMLAAFQKLSAEDRKALVTDSRAMKARMQGRMEGRREMLRSRMQMRHMGQPSAPPVPPTPPTEG